MQDLIQKFRNIWTLPWWSIVWSSYHVVPLALAHSKAIYCSLTSFFFENSVEKVSHAAFGVSTRLMCSNISSSMLVLIANMAFLALIFHFRNVLAFSRDVVSPPATISHKSSPCKYGSMQVDHVIEPSNATNSLEVHHHNLIKSRTPLNKLGPRSRASQSQTIHKQNEHLQKHYLRHHKHGS